MKVDCIKVACPLVDRIIEDIDCIECIDVTNNELAESVLPDEMKVKKDWKEICLNCKNHHYDVAEDDGQVIANLRKAMGA